MTLDSTIDTLRKVLLSAAPAHNPEEELLLNVLLTAVRDRIFSNAPSWRDDSGRFFLCSQYFHGICTELGLETTWVRGRIEKFSRIFLEHVHERERLFGPNSHRYKR